MSDALVKVEGAGNDFVLGTGTWAERLASDGGLVRRLCDRRRGVGADGVLALYEHGEAAVRLVHRNADASPSDFCANGTRCAARAAVALLGLPPRLVVRTGWADLPAEVRPDAVALELPPPSPARAVTLSVGGQSWSGWRIDVGVPHLVLPVTGLESVDVDRVGPALRSHPDLGPDGSNVHFVEDDADGELRLRSLERGVASEVLCCGSGVVAAALIALAGRTDRTVTVIPRSGDRLRVDALGEPPAAATRLTGPARLVARIELDQAW